MPTFNLTLASGWRFTKRTIGQARIQTGFHRFTEIGRIFNDKYIFNNKKAFQVEIWNVGLALPHIHSATIWKLTLMKWFADLQGFMRGTGQYPETQERRFQGAGVKIHKNSRGSKSFRWCIFRVVTNTSSCRVNTTSKWGIKQLGISFGSIFFYFPLKVAGGHVRSS